MSADPLPTVQVDGVIWSQVVVGDTVYAAGSFSTARPAGAAPGSHTTPRHNLLAYSISTGKLLTSFKPDLNAQARTVVASPDKSRIYVGGDFTKANGAPRSRIAAYSTTTGRLVRGFAPAAAAPVLAIAATGATVYLGGSFASVSGHTRPRLAAVSASTGRVTSWSPQPNAPVTALTLTAAPVKLVVGGRFTKIGSTSVYGMSALSVASAKVLPWAATKTIRDAGVNSSLASLTTLGGSVYGSGYVYGKGGNFEGTFRADGRTGRIVWMEDCHGDTYSVFPTTRVVYVASHAHNCANVGGFPESNPRVNYRATAFQNSVRGALATNKQAHYTNFAGKPAPSLLDVVPDAVAGHVHRHGSGRLERDRQREVRRVRRGVHCGERHRATRSGALRGSGSWHRTRCGRARLST